MKKLESEALSSLHNLISREETFWRQRSRIDWLKEGDRNSKFFHLTTLKHRASNCITGLTSARGWLSEEKDIASEAVAFFSSLLSKEKNITDLNQDLVVSSIPSLIQCNHNKMLVTIPDISEIKHALFSLLADKAPGLDGFPTFFFQYFWDVVNQDLVMAVQEFFGARNLLKEINATFIALVPKNPGADSLDLFRPINLCNTLYKIISKLLTLRLLKILPIIISPQQSGFVPGRQILDSIMLVHEVIHSLEVGKREGFLLKLDLSKAYDHVDWKLLEKFLTAFGFSKKVCDLVSQLVSSPTLTILINGSPTAFFKPSRGLRKGDPLSPILFIILVECFGRMIIKDRQQGIIKGLKPTSRKNSFTHQQFVDDVIMGGEASISEARSIKSLLNNYKSGTGQLINWTKSLVFFFNTPEARQRRIASILGCGIGTLPGIYLGLPLGSKPSESFWKGIIDRFNKKLVGWKGSILSQAGKIQLVKSTLQNLPTYALSLFGIPSKFSEAMEKIQRDFLWTGTEEQKRYPLVA